MAKDEVTRLASKIAKKLGEDENKPLAQLKSIVRLCKTELILEVLDKTFEVEAAGGMELERLGRRRTTGGVFFYLMQATIPDEETRAAIFPQHRRRLLARDPNALPPEPPPPPRPPFEWSKRHSTIQALSVARGEATIVKVTLIGRPGKIERHPDLVITTMAGTASTSNFPKGVPKPPEELTLYTVYIGSKQWKKVEPWIDNPEDALILEGSCAFDPEIGGIAVFVQSATTKLFEAKKREAQKEVGLARKEAIESGNEPPPDTKLPKVQPPHKSQRLAPIPTPPPVNFEIPKPVSQPGFPPEVTQKLNDLQASAALFRQKIANIQAKPAGQQFGLEMTQKLLKNVEDEIASLEKKYAK